MTDKRSKWPNGARAALCLTMDNMGEAADLQRGLWPADKSVGQHFSVTDTGPRMLELLRRHSIPATYFVESWNLDVYADYVVSVADSGVEIGWHAYQHEPWAKLTSEEAERDNFQKSANAMQRFITSNRDKSNTLQHYKGFRPPGGIIHGDRTMDLCREYGLTYISPAAEDAALISSRDDKGDLVVLPFRWRTVDAYYYMETFAALRKLKGEPTDEVLSSDVLATRYIAEIDQVIRDGGYLSLLFHPFLTDSTKRMSAMDRVLQHISKRREEGSLWVARNVEVANWILKNRNVSDDPKWDKTQWR